MYLRSQLNEYANSIQDAERATAFRAVISQIAFDTRGLCLGHSLNIFEGTGLEDLRVDFEANHLRYLTQNTLQELFGSTPPSEGEASED